jgi:small membrane protein
MNIHLGQILFVAILVFLVIYIFLLRTAHSDRVVYLACALVGILLVLAPDLSSDIAHTLGIGRGVDLIIYVFILAGLFYSVTITSELKRLQRQMTTLVRQLALDNPMQGKAPIVESAEGQTGAASKIGDSSAFDAGGGNQA